MENIHFTLTPRRAPDTGYEMAYRLARQALAETPDLEALCRKSDAQLAISGSEKKLIVKYLGQPCAVSLPEAEPAPLDGRFELTVRDRILILHYLTCARGTPLSGKAVTYKELPDGTTYFPTFYKRAIKPVVDSFGKEPSKLLEAAQALRGRKADYGDAAATVPAFSRVPVTFVLWKGDEEFPPEGNILFDSTICDYLAIEDVNVLCEIIAWKLVKLKTKTT